MDIASCFFISVVIDIMPKYLFNDRRINTYINRIIKLYNNSHLIVKIL